jgi:hypothetical protein
MKFYLASRYRNKEKLLKFSKLLVKEKHKIVSSWLKIGSLKPYEDNREYSRKIAARIVREIKSCDAFVLVSDRAGTDMFIEFGLAVAFQKKIYVVGRWNKRSLMHFCPSIVHLNKIEELLG